MPPAATRRALIGSWSSASESIAAGVVFTLPGFLFLSTADAANYFDYAVSGGSEQARLR